MKGGRQGRRDRKEEEKQASRQAKPWMDCGRAMQGMRALWQTVGSNGSRSSHRIVEGPIGHNIESGFYSHCNRQPWEGFKKKGNMI